MSEILYYGCGSGPGHYWHLPVPWHMARAGGARGGMMHEPRGDTPSRSVRKIVESGRCCPNGDRTPAPSFRELDRVQAEGVGRLSWIDGWTVLAFWDRSADRRFNSFSAYVARGKHDAEAMVRSAGEHFPQPWGRMMRHFVAGGRDDVLTVIVSTPGRGIASYVASTPTVLLVGDPAEAPGPGVVEIEVQGTGEP